MKVVQGRPVLENQHVDQAGYIEAGEENIYAEPDIYAEPNEVDIEQINTEEGIYSYAQPTGPSLEPDDGFTGVDSEHIKTEPDSNSSAQPTILSLSINMNQVQSQARDQPSSPPAPSPPAPSPPRTGLKVFGALAMTLLVIGVGCLLVLYYPGKTIFECVFYFMITLKVCDWKLIEDSVFTHAEK